MLFFLAIVIISGSILISTSTAQAQSWQPPTGHFEHCQVEGRTKVYTIHIVDAQTGAPVPEDRVGSATYEFTWDGQTHAATRVGNTFEFRFDPGAPRTFTAGARIVDGASRLEGPPFEVVVVRDTHVRAPAQVDFGDVHSGCAAEASCKPLDLSASQGLFDGVQVVLRRSAPTGTAGWPELKVTVKTQGRTTRLERDGELVLPYTGDPIEICYAPPGCKAPPPDASEGLVVAPRHACFDELDRESPSNSPREAVVLLRASVSENTWFECYRWWLYAFLALVAIAIVLYGMFSPHVFPTSATLRIGNTERALQRTPGRPLYSVPGGRRGFYRSATCTLDPEGITVQPSKAHVLQLLSGAGGRILLKPKGTSVERLERRTWVRVDREGGDDVVAENDVSSGTVYRVGGSFYFVVDY